MKLTSRTKLGGNKCNRAVDSDGKTIDFMLSAKRDKRPAKRFFCKALKMIHAPSPRVINVDKNAAYPPAIDELKTEKTIDKTCEFRQNKYLNNIVEQDHRLIKKLVNPGLGFKSFHTARRTIIGYETMNSIRKGQLQGVSNGDILGQAEFVSKIFGVAA